MPTTAFLGAGAMGEAIARGLVKAGTFAPPEIRLFDVNIERTRAWAAEIGVSAFDSASEAVSGADVVIVAVKPQVVERALAPFRDVISPSQTVISIAAGISLARLEACFSADVPIVRVMPNTPAVVGAAASALCGGTWARAGNITLARQIFEAVGLVIEVEERLIDAVTGLSGSGPAYVFMFIEALADGGVRAGLSRKAALQLAAQTVMGSAQMLLETGEHPGVLKDRVASPGGTTIAAIHALESGAFRGTVMDAVMASANRSKELG